jgi:hypothetical protein
MMWQAIGIVLLGATPAVLAAQGYDAGTMPSPSDQAGAPYMGEAPMYGDNCENCGCGPCGWFGRSCFFDSYWDYTGGRSPSDYSSACGYGPDWCHTWQARTEWLLWFSSARSAPTLVTTSPAGTPSGDAGVLDDPDTTRLFPTDELGENMRNGARVTIGRMLADNVTGVTGRFWGVENGAERFRTTTTDNAIIGLPFFNMSTFEEDALLVSFPGLTALGSVDVIAKNSLFGADAWLSRNVIHSPWVTLDLLGGYQFTRMDDSIDISSAWTSVNPALPLAIGTQFTERDSFRTQNEFHGGTIGFLADFRKDVLSVEVLGKLALGNMRQTVIVEGQGSVTPPGGPTAISEGGLLTQNTNIGRFERNKFLVVPELNVNGVWHFSPQWKAIVGYSVLYMDSVVLAGDQIDTAVNLSQAPVLVGPAFPRRQFNRNDFLVQGINFGVDYRW